MENCLKQKTEASKAETTDGKTINTCSFLNSSIGESGAPINNIKRTRLTSMIGAILNNQMQNLLSVSPLILINIPITSQPINNEGSVIKKENKQMGINQTSPDTNSSPVNCSPLRRLSTRKKTGCMTFAKTQQRKTYPYIIQKLMDD